MRSDSLLGVFVGALAVGLPALLYTIWRNRKMGPKEEDDLVTRSANQAVQAMGEVLDHARHEREDMQGTIDRLRRRVDFLEHGRNEKTVTEPPD